MRRKAVHEQAGNKSEIREYSDIKIISTEYMQGTIFAKCVKA